MKLALLTIGQSPRSDILEDVKYLLKGINYVEKGLLDELSPEEIEEHYGPEPGEEVYVSRLRSGEEVKLSKKRVVEGMKRLVKDVEDEADVILVMCTGDFEVESRKLVILPSRLLIGIVASVHIKSLGVLVPAEEQVDMARRRWGRLAEDLVVEHWSPYSGDPEELRLRARSFLNTDLIVMDCFGYGTSHAQILRRFAGRPVALPRTLSFLVALDLLGAH